jgi:hypothetical protein
MASTLSSEDAAAVLDILGLDNTEDNRDQLRVMAEAMHLYQEREAVRHGLWKLSGAKDCAHNLKHKGLRVAFASDQEALEAAVDDAHDAVNYAAFFVRNVRAGRIEESH